MNVKNIKRKLVEKIWEPPPQLIKIVFIKLVETCGDYKKYKNVKIKLVKDIWGS